MKTIFLKKDWLGSDSDLFQRIKLCKCTKFFAGITICIIDVIRASTVLAKVNVIFFLSSATVFVAHTLLLHLCQQLYIGNVSLKLGVISTRLCIMEGIDLFVNWSTALLKIGCLLMIVAWN